MLVDRLDDSFLTSVPDDFFILDKHDLNHLSIILTNNPFNMKFFHQLGPPKFYLDSVPEGSEDAHIYQKFLIVSCKDACECSNPCSDIFSMSGRNNTL